MKVERKRLPWHSKGHKEQVGMMRRQPMFPSIFYIRLPRRKGKKTTPRFGFMTDVNLSPLDAWRRGEERRIVLYHIQRCTSSYSSSINKVLLDSMQHGCCYFIFSFLVWLTPEVALKTSVRSLDVV